MMNPKIRHILDASLLIIGIFCSAFGLKGFLLSSHFIDGGVTGVSMLLANVFDWPLAWLVLIINLPFVATGLYQIGKTFALKSALAIGGLSLCLTFVTFPDVTHDKLLTAVFGGFFLGAGIGLSIRGGAVLDGTEIAALLISKASSTLHVGDVILLLNIIIFLIAAWVLGIEPALYSVLTYLSASKTIDFILYGVEEYTAVIIISQESETIRYQITSELSRGLTIYKTSGGKNREEQEVLYCVVTRLEIGKVKAVARIADPNAFIIVHPLADADGGFKQKTSIHERQS